MLVEPQTQWFGTRTSDEIFGSRRKSVVGLSASLAAGLLILGLSIGFSMGRMGIGTAAVSSFPIGNHTLDSANLILFGAIIILELLFILIFIHHGDVVLVTSSLLGIVGFMLYPLPWPESLASIGSYLIPVGFLGTAIVSWSMLTELSYSIGNDIVVGLGAGLSVFMLGAACGDTMFVILYSAGASQAVIDYAYVFVGALFVTSFALIYMANARLWNLVIENTFLFDENSSVKKSALDKQALQIDHDAQTLNEQARKHGLTERETQVLRLLLMDRSRSRIAQMLALSENTVGTHVQHIYQKFGVHGLQELLDFVITH